MRSRLPTWLISQFEVTGGGAVFLRIFLTSLSNPSGRRMSLWIGFADYDCVLKPLTPRSSSLQVVA
jgi:hypothetical protein